MVNFNDLSGKPEHGDNYEHAAEWVLTEIATALELIVLARQNIYVPMRLMSLLSACERHLAIARDYADHIAVNDDGEVEEDVEE